MEKFLKAHGALYEQKAHRLFFFLEGWNIWWWIFFIQKTHLFIQGNTQMFEVDGDVQETQMILIDSFKMSLKDGNDGIHYI